MKKSFTGDNDFKSIQRNNRRRVQKNINSNSKFAGAVANRSIKNKTAISVDTTKPISNGMKYIDKKVSSKIAYKATGFLHKNKFNSSGISRSNTHASIRISVNVAFAILAIVVMLFLTSML